MILHDLSLFQRPGVWNIRINKNKIEKIYKSGEVADSNDEQHIYLKGSLVLPGFINCHDHLDFNLFPALGNRCYLSYREWGPSIQKENKELIESIQKIPEPVRTEWGIYKNLLNGFTTVVNHGKHLHTSSELIDVIQCVQSLHSPGFEKNLWWKLNNPFLKKKMVVIHAGEGVDEESHREIDQLVKSNFLNRKITVVHGVAMDEKQAGSIKGLVWCPASNYFLFNKTAAIDRLKDKTTVVFGTDSTLTSPWNIWEHFRLALKSGMAREEELLGMLTTNAALLFGLKNKGEIKEGFDADLIVIHGEKIFDKNHFDIKLLIKNGVIKLIDDSIPDGIKSDFSRIQILGSIKKVTGNLKALYDNIKIYWQNNPEYFKII